METETVEQKLEHILSTVYYQQYPMSAANLSERMRNKLKECLQKAYSLGQQSKEVAPVDKGDRFIQGYVCAVATITSIIGEHTNVLETLKAGIGNKTAKELLALGVEKYDIDKLKEVDYL